MTLAERIVDHLRLHPAPLDDDQLARALRVEPRQAVNQACRKLRDQGLLQRLEGPDGKLVNQLVPGARDGGRPSGLAGATLVEVLDAPAGDSTEQRQAEQHMLSALSLLLGVELKPRRVTIGDVRVELDGADDQLSVLVEVWAHQGPVKGAQRLKVLTDAFKLTWVSQRIGGRPRLILCMSDKTPAVGFTTARSWAAQALRDNGVEVVVVELPAAVREGVLQAQDRQFR